MLRSLSPLLALLLACGAKDNSADTDQARKDLTKAQSALSEKRDDVATNGADVELRKREIAKEQQALADKEAALATDQQQLGSAQGKLTDARAAYIAAVTERFAKLEASLAGLATQTDAKSKDATAGLKARRDLLASGLATMPSADVDATFDAIERDLRAATR